MARSSAYGRKSWDLIIDAVGKGSHRSLRNLLARMEKRNAVQRERTIHPEYEEENELPGGGQSVIDRVTPLSEIITALHHTEAGRKMNQVIIRVREGRSTGRRQYR